MWTWSSIIVRSPLARSAAAIPLLGYLLLYSTEIRNYIDIVDVLPTPNIINPEMRINLIYWGSVFVAISVAIFYIFCPREVIRFRHPEEFAFERAHVQSYLAVAELCFDLIGFNVEENHQIHKTHKNSVIVNRSILSSNILDASDYYIDVFLKSIDEIGRDVFTLMERHNNNKQNSAEEIDHSNEIIHEKYFGKNYDLLSIFYLAEAQKNFGIGEVDTSPIENRMESLLRQCRFLRDESYDAQIIEEYIDDAFLNIKDIKSYDQNDFIFTWRLLWKYNGMNIPYAATYELAVGVYNERLSAKPILSITSAILSWLGAASLLVPSLEVSLRVLWKTLSLAV